MAVVKDNHKKDLSFMGFSVKRRNKILIKLNDYIKLAYILIIAAFIALQGVIPQELSSTFIPWMILAIIVLIFDLEIIRKKT